MYILYRRAGFPLSTFCPRKVCSTFLTTNGHLRYDNNLNSRNYTERVREGIKKRIFYGQADRKRSPPPLPSYGQLFVNFFGVLFILDYESMCSEMDLT